MFTQDEIIKMAELADAYADAMDVGGPNTGEMKDEGDTSEDMGDD